MKPKIKFSHRYVKLPLLYTTSFLKEVRLDDFANLDKQFVHFDTLYYDRDGKEQHYPLPKKGKCIVLHFSVEAHTNWGFSTVRRWTPEKAKYYTELVGKEFDIVIEEVD